MVVVFLSRPWFREHKKLLDENLYENVYCVEKEGSLSASKAYELNKLSLYFLLTFFCKRYSFFFVLCYVCFFILISFKWVEAYTSNLAPLLVQIKQKKNDRKRTTTFAGTLGAKIWNLSISSLAFFFSFTICISSYTMYILFCNVSRMLGVNWTFWKIF